MTTLLVFALVGLLVVYAGVLVMVWHFQEHIVFQPPAGVAVEAVPARQVRYSAADGAQLFAYVVGDSSPGGIVVLAFHGNADIARWLVPWATRLARQTGVTVVIPEYRGYDGLSGSPSYDSSSHDSRASLAYVRDTLKVTSGNVVYFGHSLGSGIAAELAAHEPPRSLVLQAPFSSARAMAQRLIVPGLRVLWRAISRVHFDTVARVGALTVPVWVSHGDRDLIVPVKMGREIFTAAARPGELLIVQRAGHNDVADVGGSAYWQWLEKAIGGVPTTTVAPRATTRTRSAP
ncbi:MAG: alpha/beta hydrolase [bacterium]